MGTRAQQRRDGDTSSAEGDPKAEGQVMEQPEQLEEARWSDSPPEPVERASSHLGFSSEADFGLLISKLGSLGIQDKIL